MTSAPWLLGIDTGWVAVAVELSSANAESGRIIDGPTVSRTVPSVV